jgi:hypothetical protein
MSGNNRAHRSTKISNGLIATGLVVVAILAYALIALRMHNGL